MAYDPPIGTAVALAFADAYTPPLGDAILLGGEVVPPEPQALTPDYAFLWGELAIRDRRTGAGWKLRRSISRGIGQGWQRLVALEAQVDSAWRRTYAQDNEVAALWGDVPGRASRATRSPWRSRPKNDHRRTMPWEHVVSRDASRRNRYAAPGAKDESMRIAHDALRLLDIMAFEVPWGNPPTRDVYFETKWGREYYREICWRKYEPPGSLAIVLNIRQPIAQVGDGANIPIFFDELTYDRRCRHREPSGWRDAYFYIPPTGIPAGRVRRYYTVLNAALLTRLPERTPIDVASITMAADVDSFCWSLSATLNSVAALDLLRPGAPVDVEVNINGHLWNMQVEMWSEGRVFAGGSRSVRGRSRSAQLAAPAAPLMTWTEPMARTAQQLAQAILDEVGGWTLSWQMVDWLVPGGLHSYSDKTPMQVIRDIAEAGGGMVQTDRVNKTLLVLPRRPVMPWLWSATSPDLILPEALIVAMDGEWQPGPQYNAAFVSGTADGGISARVVRAGSAGDVVAPMVTDALLSATEVALARGRHILASSGNWERQQLSLPLLPTPEVPGVIVPGALLQVQGAASWKGQAIGNSITASRTRGGVIVRQVVEVERYHGN